MSDPAPTPRALSADDLMALETQLKAERYGMEFGFPHVRDWTLPVDHSTLEALLAMARLASAPEPGDAGGMLTREDLAFIVAQFFGENYSPYDVADAILARLSQLAQGRGGVDLHPATEALVQRFADALRAKLRKAEVKYGYSDGWANANWQADCVEALHDHVAKGDPLDVAAYAAFCWHHHWPTSARPTAPADAQGDAGLSPAEIKVLGDGYMSGLHKAMSLINEHMEAALQPPAASCGEEG